MLEDFYHPTLPTNDNYNPINTTEWWAMVWTANASYTLSSININARFTNLANSSTILTMSIRATSSGAPTGSDLVSGTVTGITSSFATVSITLSSTLPVVSGTQYAMVFHASADQIQGQAQEAGSYTGGNIYNSTNSGSTWSQFLDPAAVQAWFETYSSTSSSTTPVKALMGVGL